MKINELLEGSNKHSHVRKEFSSLEKAFEQVKLHCSDALKFKDTPILRGSWRSLSDNGNIVQGDKGQRKSRNTSNHYTVILDEVLGKLGYPKRSRSIICANYKNISHARQYGGLYAVLPYNGVLIGVCPNIDIFGTKIKIGEKRWGIDSWNDFYDQYQISDKSYSRFISDLEKYTEDTVNEKPSDLTRIALSQFKPGKVKEQIEKAYSPEAAGFKLVTTKDIMFFNGEKGAHELWIGGKCIMLPLEDYQKMIKDYDHV